MYVKVRKLAVLAVLWLALLAGSACAFQPEDALTSRPDDSVYIVLRLQNTSGFLQWLFSKENLKIFAPLFLKGKSELEIMAVSEFVNALFSVNPMRSSAVVVGMTKNDAKLKTPFVQAALTFSPEVSTTVKRIEAGLARASDVAKLLIGDSTAANFAETMITIKKEKDNIYRVNNNIFMSAVDGTVLLGSSVTEIRKAVKSINDKDTRLFTKKARRFTAKDFMLMHMDLETAVKLNDDVKSKDLEVLKYFAKPLEAEFAFTRLADKFLMSIGLNFREAFKKKYADEIFAQADKWQLVKGGNIDLAGIGGTASPLLALGTYIDFDSLNEIEVWKPLLKSVLRNMRVRFKVSDEETKALLSGSLSLAVNGTATYEGFKIPAVYASQQGTKGAAAKVYDKLTNSQHFSKVKDGILQLDSSVSPISCLVADRGEKLGVYFAELASLEQKPELMPALADLMKRESIASLWMDFAGIQSWILDESNGVMMMLAPLMTFGGYGKYYKGLQEVLTAELSVPSVAIWSESPEVVHYEFAVKEINPDNGLFMRILKVYQELKAPANSKKAPEDSTKDTESREDKSK